MFIPDPRWEEPNLLIPGKKPTGPVTIDWSHPLARGLRFFYVAGHGDLAIGGETRWRSGSRPVKPVLGRMALHYSDTGTPSYAPVSSDIVVGTSGGHTMLVSHHAPQANASNYDYILGTSNTSNTGIRVEWVYLNTAPNQSARMSLTYGGVASYSIFNNTDGLNTNFINLGFSGDIGSDYDAVSDGVFVDNVAVGSIINNTSSLEFFGWTYTNNRGTQGSYEYLAYWDRRLSEPECAEFTRNPYQILCPA